jgi:hypothetical protein
MFKYIALFFLSLSVFAQEKEMDIKRNRISLHMGSPGILGINYEYVIPALDDNFAPFINIGSIGFGLDDLEYADTNKADFSFSSVMFGIGTKYYFSEGGEGFYGSIEYNYQQFDFSVESFNYFSDNLVTITDPSTGSKSEIKFTEGSLDVYLPMSQFTPKVGYTTVGESIFGSKSVGFAFGVELGWNFVFLPDNFEADIEAIAEGDFTFNGTQTTDGDKFSTTADISFFNKYLYEYKLTGYLAFAMKFGIAF